MKNLLKSKPLWTGLAGLAAAGTGYASGDFTSAETVQTVLTALLGIFLRAGLEKIK